MLYTVSGVKLENNNHKIMFIKYRLQYMYLKANENIFEVKFQEIEECKD